MQSNKPKDIDEYISGFPKDVQLKLEELRTTIKKTVPEAKETIKYSMQTFTLNGNLVHFAAFSRHIGFYLAPTGVEAFQKELEGYKTGKGSIQFPLNQALPFDLIVKMIKFRAAQLQK